MTVVPATGKRIHLDRGGVVVRGDRAVRVAGGAEAEVEVHPPEHRAQVVHDGPVQDERSGESAPWGHEERDRGALGRIAILVGDGGRDRADDRSAARRADQLRDVLRTTSRREALVPDRVPSGPPVILAKMTFGTPPTEAMPGVWLRVTLRSYSPERTCCDGESAPCPAIPAVPKGRTERTRAGSPMARTEDPGQGGPAER